MLCGQEVPFGDDLLFEDEKGEMCFGIEICEDLWVLFLQALFRRWPERWLFLIFLPAMKL